MRNTIKNPARTDRSRPRKAPSRRKAGKEEANLPERGFLRFQLGLILALFMVYFALEASFRMYGTTQPEFREAPEPIQLFFADLPPVVMEEAPVFPGCEAVEKSERQACFQDKVNEHIRKHVRYPRVEQELHIEGKVYVTFRIQADGTIADIQLKGPSPGLEDEARRLISLMPVMTPGKQRGQAVRVPFSIPISFKLH